MDTFGWSKHIAFQNKSRLVFPQINAFNVKLQQWEVLGLNQSINQSIDRCSALQTESVVVSSLLTRENCDSMETLHCFMVDFQEEVLVLLCLWSNSSSTQPVASLMDEEWVRESIPPLCSLTFSSRGHKPQKSFLVEALTLFVFV